MYEHKVLRLPPYHPDPIEKIWANVKGWTGTRNVTCNLNDVENLARGRFGQITTDDSHFPPYMWAENSSSSQRTTNACERFHSKFNASFYCGHPNIFRFIEVLKNFQIQINTYIKT
jgi:hypothetical protein